MRTLARGVTHRVDGVDGWKAARYSAVSASGIVLTQMLLAAGHAFAGLGPTTANMLAVLTAAVPVYVMNRAWVWKIRGPSSMRTEIVPFWAFTMLGLVLSTVVVAGVGSLTTSTLALNAANVFAFGVLWVAKFFVLDEVIFAGADRLVPTEPARAV